MKRFLVLSGLMLVGCRGPVGPIGPQGPEGPAGTSVTDSTYCNLKATVNGVLTTFEYEHIFYSSGDTMTFCAISDDLNTYSNQSFYDRRETTGTAATGQCVVTHDVNSPPDGRYWAFYDDAPGPRTVYTDGTNTLSTIDLTSGCSAF